MDAATLDSLGKHALVHVEFENAVNVHFLVLEHSVELLSLSDSAREAVEEDASLTLRVAQVVLDETNNEIVGDKLTTLHDTVSLLSKLGASSNSVTEHVAGSEMADAKIVLDFGALGSLSGAGGSNHDHVHSGAFGALVAALDLGKEVVKVDGAKIHLLRECFTVKLIIGR